MVLRKKLHKERPTGTEQVTGRSFMGREGQQEQSEWTEAFVGHSGVCNSNICPQPYWGAERGFPQVEDQGGVRRQWGKWLESPWTLPPCSAPRSWDQVRPPQHPGDKICPKPRGSSLTEQACALAAAGPPLSSQASPSAHLCTHSPSVCMCRP